MRRGPFSPVAHQVFPSWKGGLEAQLGDSKPIHVYSVRTDVLFCSVAHVANVVGWRYDLLTGKVLDGNLLLSASVVNSLARTSILGAPEARVGCI